MKLSPITRITVKRFRSFPSASLTLDNPLFLVGRNGSGKSNLAEEGKLPNVRGDDERGKVRRIEYDFRRLVFEGTES